MPPIIFVERKRSSLRTPKVKTDAKTDAEIDAESVLAAVKKETVELEAGSFVGRPRQKGFNLGSDHKNHWVWRVEYRVKMNDASWSEWSLWSRRPNVYLRKWQAERRLKKIQSKHISFSFEYEFAVRPFNVGIDMAAARRNEKRERSARALRKKEEQL